MANQRTIPSGLAVASIAAIAFALAGCSTQAEAPERTYVTSVSVADVETATEPLPIRSSGRLSPKTSMRLAFKTGGVIDRIFVDEGDRVRKGDTLAQLDLSEIDAQVNLASSAFEKAERDVVRMQALFADSIIALEQLQNVETALTAAESNLKMATFNRRHSEIIAPAEGRIQRRHAEPNELVSGGQPILDLGATSNWVVRMGLPDRDVVRLGLGDDAYIRLDAYPDETFSGLVTEIAEAADASSGTFEVEVSLVESPVRLKSGFIASVDIVPSETADYRVIPIEAIVEGDGRTATVYTIDESTNRARRLSVQIEGVYDDRVAISAGLDSVSTIVTDGAPYLTDGTSVRVER